MGRVTVNSLSLAMARESSLGVLPGSPVWDLLEPNSISGIGNQLTKVARRPISPNRQRRKGTTTDIDSTVEIEHDLTMSMFRNFMEQFTFARAIGPDVFLPSAATANAFTVPAVSASAAGHLKYGASAAQSLLYVRGFTNPVNNGLFVLGAAVATSATSIPVAAGSGVVAEVPAATRDTEVAIAGIRGAAGDLKIDASGDLTSIVLDFTTLGLTVGQWIHIGGTDVIHQFFDPDNYGFARISTIAAHKIELERRADVFALDDGTDTGSGGTNLRIDILFGQFIRNVPVSHPDYLEISTQFELESPNLGPSGEDMYEYSLGNYLNTIAFNLQLADKVTCTVSFVGTETIPPTTSRATNAALARIPSETEAFSASTDVARLVIAEVDETGLTTDFKQMTITLNNNVNPEKVIGRIGARYMNAGLFEADISTQVLFTSPGVLSAIRQNRTVGLYWAMRNNDGGVVCDFPSGTLDGGGREFPDNATVGLNSTFMGHEDPALGYTFSASLFPSLPSLD